METKIREFITSGRIIEPGDHVLAGVSGGADSVALLVILDRLKTSLNFKLSVCHLNHQLRGEASDTDMEFVENLCRQLHLPCYVGQKDIQAIHEKGGGTLEETARKVRYEFFEEAACQFGANKLALAHHRDDQCETIIFNLLRGSSFHGLRGIPLSRPLRPDSNIIIIRPLLAVSKSELEDFLRGCGLDWRKDHTNELLYTTRNVIRHKLLPVIQEVNPSFREHLLELGRQAGQIETILVEQAKMILAASQKDGNEIRIEQWRIKTLPEILACETIRQMLLAMEARMSRITARHLREVVTLSTKMELPQGIQARVEYGWLILGPKATKESEEEKILQVGQIYRFNRFDFSTVLRKFDEQAFKDFCRTKNKFQEWIDADKIEGELKVRHAREGERFWPLGAPGSKKVGDFLTDVKAGWSARPAIVLADERGILWLVGWRIDERVKIMDRTRNILSIKRV